MSKYRTGSHQTPPSLDTYLYRCLPLESSLFWWSQMGQIGSGAVFRRTLCIVHSTANALLRILHTTSITELVAGAILAAIRISTGVLAFSIILSCILLLVRSVQPLVTPLGLITSNKMVPLLTVLHSFIGPGSHPKYDGPTSEGSGLKQNPN